MRNIQEIISEIKGKAPYLAQLKEEGLKSAEVPDGYFESLADHVLIQARAEEGLVKRSVVKESEKIQPAIWRRLLSWQMTLATVSLLVITVFGIYWISTTAGTQQKMTLDQLEKQEIDAYITQNIGEFDMALLMESEVLSINDLEGIFSDGLSDEELDVYLEDILEELDLEDIEEVL